jgi:hypothetical protein
MPYLWYDTTLCLQNLASADNKRRERHMITIKLQKNAQIDLVHDVF